MKKSYDQSGMTENIRFDFKGNLLESNKRFAEEYIGTIDWNIDDLDTLLQTETFISETQYDALNRATSIKTPHNNNIPESEILPAYDEGGLLKAVKAKLRGSDEETEFVSNISYNPKGQRKRIAYGNGAKTKYEYDENTFRLKRLLTKRAGSEDALQDLNYNYDPVGNITQIRDDAQQTVFFNGSVVSPSQTFEYDALYRLTKATGREHASVGSAAAGGGYPQGLIQHPMPVSANDATALQNYTRMWEYDQVGNIENLIHQANQNSFTRCYGYVDGCNRLDCTMVSGTTVNYTYNQNGSMESMPHLSSMGWMPAMGIKQTGKENIDAKDDEKNKSLINNHNSQYNDKKLGEQILESAAKFTDAKEDKEQNKEWIMPENLTHITRGTTEAYYNYDSEGQRVRKVVKKGNIVEERLYLNGFEIFRRYENDVLKTERETLHIMDDEKRIAIVETLTVNNGTAVTNPTPIQRYQLSNNIDSATLELDEAANIISYEEYYPYGETSYRAGRSVSEVSQKRYRYTGKEKDEESGLYYFGARYYACWLGLWTSIDPKLQFESLYLYAGNGYNPINGKDRDGREFVNDALTIYQHAEENNFYGSSTLKKELTAKMNSKTIYFGVLGPYAKTHKARGIVEKNNDYGGYDIYIDENLSPFDQARTLMHETLGGSRTDAEGKAINPAAWHFPDTKTNKNYYDIKEKFNIDTHEKLLKFNMEGGFGTVDEIYKKEYDAGIESQNYYRMWKK